MRLVKMDSSVNGKTVQAQALTDDILIITTGISNATLLPLKSRGLGTTMISRHSIR